MSLTKNDLTAIRDVFNDAFEALAVPRFDGLETRMDGLDSRMDGLETRMDGLDERMLSQERATHALKGQIETESIATVNHLRVLGGKIDELTGKVAALEADVKYIYRHPSEGATTLSTGVKISKPSLEQKFLTLYKDFQTAAKEAGIILPR